MKALSYQQFGNTDVLRITDERKPYAQAGQVLVKVKAVSINPLDWKIRKGEMKLMSGSKFPKHTGVDFAGIVEEAGAGVTGFRKGDEVFGVVANTMKEGAMAGYVAVPAANIWKKPAHISFAQAASIPLVGAAAVTTLQKMGDIDSQSRILINGATGGFGMFLLQLLRGKGAQITAVTSARGLEFASRWGASSVLDYAKENVLEGTDRFDVVVDLSGKMGYAKAKGIMKSRSRFLNPTPQPIEIPMSLLSNLFTGKKHVVVLSKPSAENMNVLLAAIDKGLQIEVSNVFPFSKAIEAYQFAERGGYIGKVVVEMD